MDFTCKKLKNTIKYYLLNLSICIVFDQQPNVNLSVKY